MKCQNPQMELVLNFNDNNQIEGSHIILFSEGIKYSSFKSIDIRMRKMKLEESKFLVENRSYETLIENLNFEV